MIQIVFKSEVIAEIGFNCGFKLTDSNCTWF